MAADLEVRLATVAVRFGRSRQKQESLKPMTRVIVVLKIRIFALAKPRDHALLVLVHSSPSYIRPNTTPSCHYKCPLSLSPMVNWSSQGEFLHDSLSWLNLVRTLLGLYAWEWFTSLSFEWQYISRARRFKWPLIIYFANRYTLFLALLGIVLALDISDHPLDCQSFSNFNQLMCNASAGLASINLSLRTIAMWNRNKYLIAILVSLIIGHWVVLLQVATTAYWVPGQGCVALIKNSNILAAALIYTTVFDLLILSLTMWKVYRLDQTTRHLPLPSLVFRDGVMYFVISFLVNTLGTIFMFLRLNPPMTVVGYIPAVTVSTIAAGRVVRRLHNFGDTDEKVTPPETMPTQIITSVAFDHMVTTRIGTRNDTGYNTRSSR